MEKFYQDSYNDYLSLKNDYRSRQVERETRGDPEQLTRRFEQRRASSLVYGEDDSPRTYRFLPNRQISNEGASEHSSYSKIRTERSEISGDTPRDARSSTSATRTVTFSNSLNANDSQSEMAGIETRLERLRRLREELGLPAENNAGATNASSSNYESSSISSSNRMQSSAGSDSRGKDKWLTQESSNLSNGGESSYSSKFRSSLRNGQDGDDTSTYTSRTSRFSAPSADDETTTVTRTSRFKSSTIDDDTPSYTPKSSRFKLSDSNGNDSSFESSSTTSTRKKRVEKPSLEGIDMNFDDDALLSDMRKKLPTSSEILDRIKNMDIE